MLVEFSLNLRICECYNLNFTYLFTCMKVISVDQIKLFFANCPLSLFNS